MTRIRIPNRRQAEAFDIEHDGIRYRASISRNEDGEVLAALLDAGKPGSALQAMARDAAVLTSLALQFGAPIHTLRHAVTRLDDGKAAGPLGSLLDALAGMGP